MKKLIAMIVILMSIAVSLFGSDLPGLFQPKDKDTWFGLDKLKHFTSSIYLTTTAYYIQSRIMTVSEPESKFNSGAIVISLGLTKEFYDSRRTDGFFSFSDLAWDLAGSSVALIFINQIR